MLRICIANRDGMVFRGGSDHVVPALRSDARPWSGIMSASCVAVEGPRAAGECNMSLCGRRSRVRASSKSRGENMFACSLHSTNMEKRETVSSN